MVLFISWIIIELDNRVCVVSFYIQIRLIQRGLYMAFSAILLVFENSHVFVLQVSKFIDL